jgi:hypothetical protein
MTIVAAISRFVAEYRQIMEHARTGKNPHLNGQAGQRKR